MQKFWTVIGFFATATPVGILLGVILSSVSNSDAAAAVSALASGTDHPSFHREAWKCFPDTCCLASMLALQANALPCA